MLSVTNDATRTTEFLIATITVCQYATLMISKSGVRWFICKKETWLPVA